MTTIIFAAAPALAPPANTGTLQGTTKSARGFLSTYAPSMLIATTAPSSFNGMDGNALSGMFAPANALFSDSAPGIMHGFASAAHARISSITFVQPNVLNGGALPATSAFTSSFESFGSLQGVMPAPRGFFTTYAPGIMAATTKPASGFFWQAPTYVGGVSVYQSPGVMSIYGGGVVQIIVERMKFHQTPHGQPTFTLVDGVSIDDEEVSILRGLSKAVDRINLVDALSTIFRLLVEDGFKLDDAESFSVSALLEVIDSIRLLAGAGSSLHALNVVASAIALDDILRFNRLEVLTEHAAFDDALNARLSARMNQVSGLLLDDAQTNHVKIGLLVEDGMLIDDAPMTMLQAFSMLSDGIAFSATIKIGDTLYLAWVVNTETKAFSQYENYPFNSFCDQTDGSYLGAADDGIYQLTGDTDNGAAINARMRWGLSKLGSGKMKRIPAMYLGYSASGQLVLKVITTSPDGEKIQNWYSLAPRHAGASREGRIKIGRGLRSVYWDFEVANVAGADFSLDTIELYPLVLDRRLGGSP